MALAISVGIKTETQKLWPILAQIWTPQSFDDKDAAISVKTIMQTWLNQWSSWQGSPTHATPFDPPLISLLLLRNRKSCCDTFPWFIDQPNITLSPKGGYTLPDNFTRYGDEFFFECDAELDEKVADAKLYWTTDKTGLESLKITDKTPVGIAVSYQNPSSPLG